MYLRLSDYLQSNQVESINKIKFITFATILYCIYGFSLLVEYFSIIIAY